MLVKLQDNGPPLFSGVELVKVKPRRRLRFRGIKLEPGATVRGVLSENVPRPVKGYVMATSVPEPIVRMRDKQLSVIWFDSCDMAPDGSFVFPSLPRTGQLQLIAVCEGWLSTTISKDPAARHQVMGQVFDVNQVTAGEKQAQPLVLKMEPTGTLEISLSNEDGRPLTEGRITGWADQRNLTGGSNTLGFRWRSEPHVRKQLLPPEQQVDSRQREEPPFAGDVSPTGTATLTGLPVGCSVSINLAHSGYWLKGSDERGYLQVRVDSAEPVKMKLTAIQEKTSRFRLPQR